MRLLLVAQFFPPDIGGEERHVFNLANTLADRGHEVSVATQRMAGAPDEEVLPSGVQVYRFGTLAMRLSGVYSTDRPHHPPLPDPVGVGELRRIIARTRPEVVHAHNWAVNSVLPLHRVHRRSTRAPFGLVLTLHDYSQVCATKRLMRNGALCAGPSPARCLPCASGHYGPAIGTATVAATAAMRPWKAHSIDHIVCVSRAVASGNHLRYGDRTSVIPNFIPDAMLRSPDEGPAGPASAAGSPELPEKEFLLFVGDLSAEKGVPTLLRAYENLGPDRPELVLVGRRTPDTPVNLPDGAQVQVEWAHENVMEAFRRCTAAVLPSVWPDPCPTTVLEAMASGCPVVTTSIGGMTDMVVDHESGLLVAPGNVPALTRAISDLLADEFLRAKYAAAARERVRLFTATAVAERLEAVYAKVAAQR
jgi:glycosyltransferase involved in cell wall biosynthesis